LALYGCPPQQGGQPGAASGGAGAKKAGAAGATKGGTAAAPAAKPGAGPAAKPGGAPVKIVLWFSYRAAERAALEKIVAEFNASRKDIQVETLFIPYDAFADKITATIPRGAGPDLFIFAHDRIGDWAKAKVIEPIEFFVGTDQALLGRFFENTVDCLTYNKSLWGLPMAFKSVALIYNKKLVPKPPTTTDELIELGKRLTDKAAKSYGLVYENANFYHHAAWMHGFGGAVFDATGAISLNSDAIAKSMAFARDLRAVHGIVPEDVSSILVTSLFNNGKAAMVINGPWFLGEIEAGVDYGVAVLPSIVPAGNAPAKPFMTSEGVIMSSHSKHKREAFEFMKFVTSDASAKARALQGKQSVANKRVYDDPAVAANPVLRVFKEQMQASVPMPNTPEMLAVWTPATTALNSVIKGGSTAPVALKKAQADVLYRLKPDDEDEDEEEEEDE